MAAVLVGFFRVADSLLDFLVALGSLFPMYFNTVLGFTALQL
jgi:hypothetical protein